MSTTPNLGLVLWDSPSDEFNPSELAANFQAIDDDAVTPRPADRVEILAALPGAGNFQGRLVYLSAADGGFPADTVVRYQGATWRAVGPFEVHDSLPVTNLYDGRVILLRLASGGFSAKSLVVYNSTAVALQRADRGIDVVATLPASPTAGQVVVLSSADGGFSAWNVVRYDGSAWALIGPQAVPPGTEIVYSTQATTATTTNVASPGDLLLTFSAATFENAKHYLEVSIPVLSHSAGANNVFFLLRAAGSTVGTIMRTRAMDSTGGSVNFKMPFTPSAGAHTYSINWYLDAAGTASITATGLTPAVFRIFKA